VDLAVIVSSDDDRVALIKAYVSQLRSLDDFLFAQGLVLIFCQVKNVNL
jgi:hypothetical protein